LLAAALSGGYAQFVTDRTISFSGFNTAVAESKNDIAFISSQLQAAYLKTYGNWYVKPSVALGLTYLDREGLTETGGGSAILNVDGSHDTTFFISPKVEFGTNYSIDSDTTMRPFIKLGMTYFASNKHRMTSSFVSAPAGTGSFTTTSEFDDVFADIEAGTSIFKTDGTTLSLGYKGKFSDNTKQHGIYAKGRVKF